MRNIDVRDAKTVYLINRGAQGFLYSMIFTATLIYQVETAGLNPLQLVLVGTVLEATILLFEIPTGIVADVYSRRLSVIIGVFITGIAFLVLGSFSAFGMILLAQVIWGIGFTFTSGATSAWIVDEVGQQNAGPVLLQGLQVSGLVAVFGIALGVVLGSMLIQLPILLGGLLFVVLAGFLIMMMPETNFTSLASADRSSWQQMAAILREGIQVVRVQPILLIIFGITIVNGAFSEGYDRLYTAHFFRDVGFPDIAGLEPIFWLGAISATVHVLYSGGAYLIRTRMNIDDQRLMTSLLAALTVVIGVSVVAFGLSGKFGIALPLALLVSLARHLRVPLMETWLNLHIDSRVRATVLSMNGQVDALGQIGLGPVYGIIATARSIPTALVISGASLLPALLLFAMVLRKGVVSRIVPQRSSTD